VDALAYARERAPLVERALEAALPAADAPPLRLHAAMRHLVFPGGKRLRPVLALAAAEAVGAPVERALGVAAAVELIHTYSLVHDDLPCMDDDDERRGRPTVHAAFDEATAVLAGDALLALAFATALAEADDGVAPQQRLAAVRELAHAAGSQKLVGGQADDLAFDGESADLAHVESIHLRKTAALIASSIVGGALAAGADGQTLARLRRFGEAVGLVFQIADDLLDAGDDDGCSLVHQVGPEAARKRAEGLLEGALKEVEPLGPRAEPLRALARFALWRDV
jgi:geranylgeranyl pyrophosphate synthase